MAAMFNNQKQYWETARRHIQWKNRKGMLLDRTARIIGRWRESCGNWPVNFGFLARAKSYLTLPPVTSEEPIT
jgi:hypothetical protein